ncbi:30S ribosomal protein S5 [Candidatus Undinarchaeota archaeon]
MSQKRKRMQRGPRKKKPEEIVEWIPKTRLGKLVKSGEITSLDEIFNNGLNIQEPEIIDALLPDLEESVVEIGRAGRPFKMVQRMTDSGRRNNFLVIIIVGNGDGYVGLGQGRATDYGPALRKALRNAKLNLIRVPRGCGSWECGCGTGHSLPVGIWGKCGSVRVHIKAAPKGIGLATSKTTKLLLKHAGIKDAWSKSMGHTRTRVNLAKATFDALNNLNKIKNLK